MPARSFNVHVDPEELAIGDLAEAVPVPSVLAETTSRRERRQKSKSKSKHGAADERLAARQRSEREHSSRASGVGSGRSYAFRRS